jgi:gluconokinase
VAKRALALDLGSSSVRAIVFELAGGGNLGQVEGAVARRQRQVDRTSPGQATFDADSYFADMVGCIDELHDRGLLDGVSDVGVDSQWHSVLPLGRSGQPLGEVVAWQDTRAYTHFAPGATGSSGGASPGEASRGEASRGEAERLEALRQRTGCAFAGFYWTQKVPWLVSAGGAGGAAKFVGLADYVGLRLFGDPSTSVSMASGTGLLATANLDWDPEAVEIAGIKKAQLPALAPRDWLGKPRDKWLRRWPELAAAAWHPVMGDGAAANLGAGCDEPGKAAVTIGTSAAVRVVRPALEGSPLGPGLWRYRVDHDRVVVGAAFSSGGQLYRWALALWEGRGALSGPQLSGPAQGEIRYDVAMPVGAGSGGVAVLPWHSGTRPPVTAVPADEGVVFGLGLTHGGAHIVSAAAEAICFELAGGLDELEEGDPTLQIVAGGGALEGSSWWRQRLASALARPVRFSADAETSAVGAAAAALGASVGAVAGEVVQPVKEEIAALAEARRRWEHWRDTVLPLAAGLP